MIRFLKSLLILYLVFTKVDTFSQEYRNLAIQELSLAIKDFEKFDWNTLTKQQFEIIKIDTFNSAKQVTRHLDFNFYQTYYSFNLIFENGMEIIQMSTISKNDSICGITYTSNWSHDTVFYFNSELQSLIEKHNEFYNTEYNYKDFKKQISQEFCVGDCGDPPVIQNPRRYNDVIGKKVNKQIFINWTKSFNPELQTIGYNALIYLDPKALERKKREETKILLHIKNRDTLVLIGSGCFSKYQSNF